MQPNGITPSGARAGLQLLVAAKKPPSHAERVAIVEQLRTHGHGIQAVAKRNGLSYNGVVSILIEKLEIEKREAYNRGVVIGRNSWLPPHDPSAARRAA